MGADGLHWTPRFAAAASSAPAGPVGVAALLFGVVLLGCPAKEGAPLDTSGGDDTACFEEPPEVPCQAPPNNLACGACDQAWDCYVESGGSVVWTNRWQPCVCIEEDGSFDYDNPDCKSSEY